jgi:hypothetical protein
MFTEITDFAGKDTSHYMRIAWVRVKQFMGYLYRVPEGGSVKRWWEVRVRQCVLQDRRWPRRLHSVYNQANLVVECL